MKKKQLLVMVAMMLVVAMVSVAGTMAFLTSLSAQVTNTFTVGNLNITLDEQDVDEYGVNDGATRVTANTYKLVPGHSYTKDPIVHVTVGSEPCYLFVKVENEITGIEDAKTIATQMSENGWTLVSGSTNVYAYNTFVDARTEAKNVTVFESFKIKSDADVSGYANKTIKVTAYAIQKDGFADAAAAWAGAPTDWQ